jgi:lipopolysaccharide biosynthesis glycosyltransferase
MAEWEPPMDDVSVDDEIVFNVQGHDDVNPLRHLDRGDGIARHDIKFEKPIKIHHFTGEKQPWPIWHRMFGRIVNMNGWQNDLANRLFGLLRGPALEVA